jgi:hypothetical protein
MEVRDYIVQKNNRPTAILSYREEGNTFRAIQGTLVSSYIKEGVMFVNLLKAGEENCSHVFPVLNLISLRIIS